jgi:hypothetical protein
MGLKGTQTEKNLLLAYRAGQQQNLFFLRCAKEGYEQIAAIFRDSRSRT